MEILARVWTKHEMRPRKRNGEVIKDNNGKVMKFYDPKMIWYSKITFVPTKNSTIFIHKDYCGYTVERIDYTLHDNSIDIFITDSDLDDTFPDIYENYIKDYPYVD
jgi:hypothetical protein